jgi:hypothetical protein
MGLFRMPQLSPAARSARARLGGLKRCAVPPDDPRYAEAKRDLRAHKLIDHIERALAESPPLTYAQLAHLMELLGGVNA